MEKNIGKNTDSTKVEKRLDDLKNQEKSTFICNCKELDISHTSSLTHDAGVEDAMPCYDKQKEGKIKITICDRCHGSLIPHGGIFNKETLFEYFEIEDTEELIKTMGDGYVGTGASRNRIKRLFKRCVGCRYNPKKGHAGETLKLSLKNQGVLDELGMERTEENGLIN